LAAIYVITFLPEQCKWCCIELGMR